MEELVTKDSTPSSACWQAMEEMARRRHIEQWLQGLLEEEVTQFLGRPAIVAAAKANADTATATASRGRLSAPAR